MAQTNKAYSLYPAEKRVFTLRQASGQRTVNPKLTGLVCSDVLGEGPVSRFGLKMLREGNDEPSPDKKITPSTETVLLSACWAIPLLEDYFKVDEKPDHENRFRSQLEGHIGLIFQSNPNLQEVIVADRLVAGSLVEAPYNGHFRRR